MVYISSNSCTHHSAEECIVGNTVEFFQKIIHGISLVFAPHARAWAVARNNCMHCRKGQEEE